MIFRSYVAAQRNAESDLPVFDWIQITTPDRSDKLSSAEILLERLPQRFEAVHSCFTPREDMVYGRMRFRQLAAGLSLDCMDCGARFEYTGLLNGFPSLSKFMRDITGSEAPVTEICPHCLGYPARLTTCFVCFKSGILQEAKAKARLIEVVSLTLDDENNQLIESNDHYKVTAKSPADLEIGDLAVRIEDGNNFLVYDFIGINQLLWDRGLSNFVFQSPEIFLDFLRANFSNFENMLPEDKLADFLVTQALSKS